MCQRVVIWPERHQLLRQQHLDEETPGGARWIDWRDVQGLRDKILLPWLAHFPLQLKLSENWCNNSKKWTPVFSAPWCEPEAWLSVIAKNFTFTFTLVTALASRLAMLLHSVPLNCPLVSCSQLAAPSQLPRAAHVQCVPSRAENVSCKSALRGSVPCWRRRCRVVSMRRTGWAPPGLDTEPTRTSSSALYPDEGKKEGNLKLIASSKLYLTRRF